MFKDLRIRGRCSCDEEEDGGELEVAAHFWTTI
jgi:hypothetical protein